MLVISVSSWNSKNGMNTWPSLLENFPPDNVANICLREEHPDSRVCDNYFVISENKVIKSWLKRSVKTGYRVERSDCVKENQSLREHNARYSKMRKKRSFWRLAAREIVWKFGRWKTAELTSFIKEFSPDVILYSMDGYIHLNRICKYAIKITGAKSIGFFVDDNFTYKQSPKIGNKAFRFFQRRSLKKLVKVTGGFWAITDMTKEEADKTFGISCTIITKPLFKEPQYVKKTFFDPIKILYTGNLLIGRDRSLLKIVESIKKIDAAESKVVVDVYTTTKLGEETLKMLNLPFCKIHEPVSQTEVLELQNNADVLLFLEDIDGDDSMTARLSFSTKITDYFSCGRCIFAVGCSETAVMRYFENNDAAIIASSDVEIKEKIELILSNTDILNEYAKKACECGIRNHKREEILSRVEGTINEILSGKSNQ